MTDDEEPGGELVSFTNEAEVRKLVDAVATLEQYAADLPTLTQFRQAAAAHTSNLLFRTLRGDFGDPRNQKEAMQVANAVIDLVTKRELAALGDEIAKIEDPAERQAMLAELTQRAKEGRAP